MAGGVFVGSVYATMELQTGGFAGDIARAQTQLKGFDQTQAQSARTSQGWATTANKSFTSIGDGLTSLATKLAVVGVAGGALGGVFVKSAADLQQSAKSMEVLTGSTEVANKLFGQLATYANSTPFEFPNIAKGAQVMLGFGVEADKVYGHIQTLGDIAAATGADFESLSLVFGQVNATGKLMGQDALQLINNKVPITTILAKKLGKSVQDVRADMEDGKISAQIFNEALTDVTKKGGFAFKGVDVLAQSFNGRMSTLTDTIMEFGRNLIGVKVDPKFGLQIQKGGIFDQLSNAIPVLIDKLQEITPAMQSAFKWLVDNGQTIIAIIGGFGAALVAAKVGAFATAMANFITPFLVLTKILPAATAAQWGLNTAMAANPVGLIVAAIVALAGALAFLQIKFDIFGKAFRAIEPIVSGVWNALKVIVTGDFKGGIFGFEEDHPVIGALLTLHDVLSTIVGVVKDNLTAAWNSLKTAFDTIATALKPVIDPLVEFAKTHGPTIMKVIGGVGLALLALPLLPIVAAIGAVIAVVVAASAVIRALAAAFNWVVGAIQAVGDWIGGFLYNSFVTIQSVVNTVGAVFTTVFTAIQNVVATVFTAIFGFWTTYLKPVFDAYMYVLNAVWTVTSTIFNAIATIIGTVVSTIVQIIGVVLVGTFNWLKANVLVPLGSFFASIFNGIRSVVTNVVNAVSAVIRTVWTAISNFLRPILQAIGNVVSSVFNGIRNTVSNIMNGVRSIISSIWGGISGTVSSIVNGIRNTVSGAFNGVVNAVRGGMQSAYNTVTGFVGNFLSAGKNIIDGIVRGVSNGAGAVTNKIKEICSGALDAVKNFFGIKSPSRVMAKMGGYLMQGFAGGVDDQSKMMERTMYRASEKAQNAFNPVASLSTQFDYGKIGKAGTQTADANGMSQETNFNGPVTINREVDANRAISILSQRQVFVDKGLVVAPGGI